MVIAEEGRVLSTSRGAATLMGQEGSASKSASGIGEEGPVGTAPRSAPAIGEGGVGNVSVTSEECPRKAQREA